MADEWKPLKSIEHLDGLNGLDIGSALFKEYLKWYKELPIRQIIRLEEISNV